MRDERPAATQPGYPVPGAARPAAPPCSGRTPRLRPARLPRRTRSPRPAHLPVNLAWDWHCVLFPRHLRSTARANIWRITYAQTAYLVENKGLELSGDLIEGKLELAAIRLSVLLSAHWQLAGGRCVLAYVASSFDALYPDMMLCAATARSSPTAALGKGLYG